VRLIEIFWSQHSKLYLKANAIKGLAEYRALQSRLNTAANHVEAFEVLKLCLTKELGLAQVPIERLPRVSEQDTNLSLEQIISGT
jgi:hypothetical protein